MGILEHIDYRYIYTHIPKSLIGDTQACSCFTELIIIENTKLNLTQLCANISDFS